MSARLGQGKAFVIEADEYDTAFDKAQQEFVLPAGRTAINNLELEYADIFPDGGPSKRSSINW